MNQDYSTALLKKHTRELRILKEKGLLDSTLICRPIPSPRKLGYRTVFKLAVRKESNQKSKKRFRIGLFQPGSHQIGPDLTGCPLHSPILRKLLKVLSPLLEESNLKPYDEKQNSGELKYIIARTNCEGSALMITWVVTRAVPEVLKRLSYEIQKRGFPLEVSAMNLHPMPSNSIWGPETVLLSSQDSIEERIANLIFKIGPSSFFQVNPWQAENIYLRIGKIAQEQKEKILAWDLYSGVGTISCLLSKNFSRVVSFEENTESAKLISVNAQRNKCGERVTTREGLAEKQMLAEPFDNGIPSLIVANPSRRGIQEQARAFIVETMEQSRGTEFVYLSCHVETLARDLIYFRKKRIVPFEVQAFDMHAQTDQLEWLVRLQKVSK